MNRSLTLQEEAQAQFLWPNIDVRAVVVTDNATHRYNCIAWTLGVTTSWIWPWSSPNPTKSEFDLFYQSQGFVPSAFGPIASFGLSLSKMTHAAVSGPRHGPRWESKCGVWLRIQHGLSELEGGGVYGNVLGFYSVPETNAIDEPAVVEGESFMKAQKLSKTDTKFLNIFVNEVDPSLRARFEKSYGDWRDVWTHPCIVLSSNPHDRTHTPAFLELIALGPDILPLLMEKLTHADEFFALQAVDRLLKPDMIVRFEPSDPAALLGEQHRAFETVKRWIRRVA